MRELTSKSKTQRRRASRITQIGRRFSDTGKKGGELIQGSFLEAAQDIAGASMAILESYAIVCSE
jgi:hypothetical protein